MISYRNQSIDLQSKSMDWFLYDIGLLHERVKIARNEYHHTKNEIVIEINGYLSLYVIYQRPTKYLMKDPLLYIKLGSKCKPVSDLFVFHHGF